MYVESVRRVALTAAALALVVLVVTSGSLAAVSTSVGTETGDDATAQTTQIRSCTTITEPGRYVLVTDIENATETCIEIKADSVTFSGAGHAIDAADARFARHTGIRVTDAADVVVRNVTVSDWGFAGVYLRGVSESQVLNVTATDGRFGITVRSSRRVEVAGSNATNNSAAGIDVSTTRESGVVDNVVADNRVGVSLTTGSNENRVVGNAIRNNELGLVLSNSDNNLVANNTFCGNGEAILRLEQPRANEFEDNRFC